MAGLINTAEGYMAQSAGQLLVQNAVLLSQVDKLQSEIEALNAKLAAAEKPTAGDNLHA